MRGDGEPLSSAYVGLGSNRGGRLGYLRDAVAALSERAGEVKAVSSVYETEPVGVTNQPPFLNAAVQVDTPMSARAFFETLQETERRLGRRPSQRWGPREIDLDLLLFGSRCIESGGLTIPHPRMLQRRFVLEPLAEIAPDAVHPRLGGRISDWLASLSRFAADSPLVTPVLEGTELF